MNGRTWNRGSAESHMGEFSPDRKISQENIKISISRIVNLQKCPWYLVFCKIFIITPNLLLLVPTTRMVEYYENMCVTPNSVLLAPTIHMVE